MSRPDARFLSKEVQEYLREQAIRLRQEGKRFKEISQYLGVHRNTVSQWWRQYRQHGEEALHQQVRGRSPGEKRTLSRDEEMLLQQWLFVWFPNDLGIDSALWTRRSRSSFNPTKIWSKNANKNSRRIPEAMGLYSPETVATSL